MPGRPPRVTKTEAIVLRYRRLGEADRIVSLLTPHRGKLDVVARGVLRSRSKLAGHLEPGTRLEVALAAGRSMDIVTQAQGLDSFAAMRDGCEWNVRLTEVDNRPLLSQFRTTFDQYWADEVFEPYDRARFLR